MARTEIQHQDSIGVEEPHVNPDKKQKTRRPANTAFRQQRLKAWQPILTPKTVLPLFFAVGIIFAPIGGLLLWSSAKVQEISIDYTDCNITAPVGSTSEDFKNIPSSKISTSFRSSSQGNPPTWRRTPDTLVTPQYGAQLNTTVCSLQFEIPNDIGPPVLLYYRLTDFYQNHRRYVKSLNTEQMKGTALSNDTIKGSACDPLKLDKDGKAYYPCGLIANSLFNDTINQPLLLNPPNSTEQNRTYDMKNKGIAWSSDSQLYKKTEYTRDQVSPPPNWALRYPHGYTADNDIPDISTYEEFQNWMRTAGLPTFSKLALRNDETLMQQGRYQIDVYDFFPVSVYGGTKSILITTRTVMGGKNPFLGIAYIIVGGICIVLGVVFTAAHLVKPRKLGDHTYLSWNNEATSTAAATGRDSRPGTRNA